MPGFLDELVVAPQPDGRTWITKQPFRWQNGRTYEVPARFVHDFASIPFFLWSLPGFGPIGKHQWAAVVHDWNYWSQGISRREADVVLLNGMRDAGTRLFHRWAIYGACRLFGWWAWRANQKMRAAGIDRVLSEDPARWTKLPPTGFERVLLTILGRAA